MRVVRLDQNGIFGVCHFIVIKITGVWVCKRGGLNVRAAYEKRARQVSKVTTLMVVISVKITKIGGVIVNYSVISIKIT